MAIWDDNVLSLFREQAERELSNEVPHIFKRTTLAVTNGQKEYDVPEGIINILSIRYKGKTVTPTTERELETLYATITPNDTTTGVPRFYIRQNQGRKKIRFYPAPNETITADDSTLTYIDQYVNKVVIGAMVESDQNDEDYRTPDFLLRRLIKHYVNYRAFLMESRGQKIRAAQYYKNRWEFAKEHLRSARSNLFKATWHKMAATKPNRRYPARPILPPEFG